MESEALSLINVVTMDEEDTHAFEQPPELDDVSCVLFVCLFVDDDVSIMKVWLYVLFVLFCWFVCFVFSLFQEG
jgi:hypothetical protein